MEKTRFFLVIDDTRGVLRGMLFDKTTLLSIMNTWGVERALCNEIIPKKFSSMCTVKGKDITDVACYSCKMFRPLIVDAESGEDDVENERMCLFRGVLHKNPEYAHKVEEAIVLCADGTFLKGAEYAKDSLA